MGRNRGKEGSDHFSGISMLAKKGSLHIFCPRCIAKIHFAFHFLLTLEAKQGLTHEH